jgi:hypothetical protein
MRLGSEFRFDVPVRTRFLGRGSLDDEWLPYQAMLRAGPSRVVVSTSSSIVFVSPPPAVRESRVVGSNVRKFGLPAGQLLVSPHRRKATMELGDSDWPLPRKQTFYEGSNRSRHPWRWLVGQRSTCQK